MERRHIKWLPLLLAGLFLAYQYFSSEKFVNPETGRKSHVAMSTRDEALLGLQTYQQVLGQSETISTGPEFETVKGVASRLASATACTGPPAPAKSSAPWARWLPGRARRDMARAPAERQAPPCGARRDRGSSHLRIPGKRDPHESRARQTSGHQSARSEALDGPCPCVTAARPRAGRAF